MQASCMSLQEYLLSGLTEQAGRAEVLGAPLVTAEGRLARAASPRCGVELLA